MYWTNFDFAVIIATAQCTHPISKQLNVTVLRICNAFMCWHTKGIWFRFSCNNHSISISVVTQSLLSNFCCIHLRTHNQNEISNCDDANTQTIWLDFLFQWLWYNQSMKTFQRFEAITVNKCPKHTNSLRYCLKQY